MIKEIIEKWDKHKGNLEQWFKTTHPKDYKEIVEKLFELVINNFKNDWDNFRVSDITVIDDGDYQGTQIFFIPKDVYQPGVNDYVFTDTSYGSCSGCDTLQGIQEISEDPPSEEQVKDYMTLALHLVQKLKWLCNKE